MEPLAKGGVVLFGATSMLGWSILRARSIVGQGSIARQRGTHEISRAPFVAFANRKTRRMPPGVSHAIDLDDRTSVARLFAELRPQLIFQCAGVCDVENCERSPDFAWAVNVEAMQNLVDYAPPECRMVYLSSDHVFSGDTGPYHEDSPSDPLTTYGHTRVAAEQLMLARPNTVVIRSGLWVGPSASGKNGHLDWLTYRTRRNMPTTVIADEARSAVWADDGGRRVWALAGSTITGIRHLTASHVVARPQLARSLNDRFAIGATISVATRRDRPVPHLGHVELLTRHTGPLAAPLPSPLHSPPPRDTKPGVVAASQPRRLAHDGMI